MADGRITIDTSINTKGIVEGNDKIIQSSRKMAKDVDRLQESVRNSFAKQADSIQKAARSYIDQQEKVGDLNRKLKELEEQKIPTDEYKKLDAQAQKTESAINKLIDKQEEFIDKGGDVSSKKFSDMESEIDRLRGKFEEINAEKSKLESKGKAFTPGGETAAADDLRNKIASAEQRELEMFRSLSTSYSHLSSMIDKYSKESMNASNATNSLSQAENALSESSSGATRMVGPLQATLRGLMTVLKSPVFLSKGIFSGIISGLKNLSKSAQKSLVALAQLTGRGIIGGLKKITTGIFGLDKATRKSNSGMGMSLKTMIRYGIGVESLFTLINRLRSAVRDGMKNLAQYSGATNATLSALISSLDQCKNALATAFDPILQAIAPALNYMINLVTAAATAVAQLIAILTGKGTFIKATKVQKDYAKSLKATGGAAKGAGEDAEGALAPFDKLNVMADEASHGGGGGGGSISPGDMFETVEVSDSFKAIAKVLSDLFKPFKDAWETDGKSVIDAAKYALSSMGELAKSVGRSFMEVWTNGTGVKVVSEFLQISKNLLTIIGNIATRLNEAWNENEVGTRIIQSVFDLFVSILDTVRRITGATAEWAATLDFTPLLESISTLLEALKPITDTVGKGLEWFWNNVLLPISGWTIEEAVPKFIDMLSSAVKALDKVVTAFKPAFTWLWDNFFEPLGEWTGNVIISAMEKIKGLLDKIGDWVSQHSEEVRQFGIIVGAVGAAFVSVNTAVALVSGALPVLAGAIKSVIGVITGPIGIIFALTAMVVATGHGEEMINNLKTVLEGLRDFVVGVFTGDWEKAWEGAKKAVSGFVDSIRALLNSAMDAIDKLLGKTRELKENTKGPIGQLSSGPHRLTGRSISTMSFSPSAEPVTLPRLASGTVVPPRAGEFAAILGDNNRESEVVSPVPTMKQAFLEALGEFEGASGGDISLTINLDGKAIYQDVVKRNRAEKDRTGRNLLLI